MKRKVLNSLTLVCMEAGRLRDAKMYCERALAIASTRSNVELLNGRLRDIRIRETNASAIHTRRP